MSGLIVGVYFGGHLLERVGRRHSLGLGAALRGFGVGMQVGSRKRKLFLGGRGVAGEFLVLDPSYQEEGIDDLLAAIGFGLALTEFPV
jgi:MFS family permease